MRLPAATADTGKLIQAAMTLLGQLWRPRYRYKKAGLILLDLAPAGRVEAGLFEPPDDARTLACDTLNGRFGRGTIGFGRSGERQRFTLRREFTSPRYTTASDDLLKVG